MLQKAFFNLYTALIALFDKALPQLVPLALYKQSIFNPVGLWTLTMALGLGLTFYYVFNGDQLPLLNEKKWAYARHWLLMLLLALGLGAWLAYFIGLTLGAVREPYLRYFIVVNALVAGLWFILWSLLLKRFSAHSSSTPFRGAVPLAFLTPCPFAPK
ncbi:MAG: hypothetical protein WKG07_23340 [Hymenobacter sp.]